MGEHGRGGGSKNLRCLLKEIQGLVLEKICEEAFQMSFKVRWHLRCDAKT